MKILRRLLKSICERRMLGPATVIPETIDAVLFGTDETTCGTPHCVDGLDSKRFMLFVIIGLLPATLASIHAYGLRAVAVILVSYSVGAVVELTFAVVRKKDVHEGFFVTGLIFPLTLPPTVPLWVVAVGVFFGIMFGKEVFGGTGRNIFNPALVGRLFITIAFPAIMTTSWQVPFADVDAVAGATPLGLFKTSQAVAPLRDLLLGRTAGSMGEGFRLWLIAGGLFLIFTRVSNWRIPFSYIGTVLALSAIGHHFLPAKIAPPLFGVFSGGLMLGALFMATDPVTTPFTRVGRYTFGVLCGLLTVLIRGFSGYVEGVMFSIVLLNGLTPIIDHVVLGVKYRAGTSGSAGARLKCRAVRQAGATVNGPGSQSGTDGAGRKLPGPPQ